MKTKNMLVAFVALAIYGGSVAQATFSPQELLSAAQLAERNKDYDQAEFYLKKAMDFDETESAAVFALAKVYMAKEDYIGAHFLVRDHLDKKTPFSLDMRLLNADVLRKLGNFDGALAEVQHVDGLRPGYVPAKKRKGYFLFEAGKYEAAEVALTDYLKEEPNNLVARQMRAECYVKLGKAAQAIADLKIVQKDNPASVAMGIAFGEAYGQTKQWGEGEIAIRSVLKSNPNSVALYEKLGDMQIGKKDTKSAIESFKKATVLDALNMEAGIKLVNAYVELGMKKEAEQELKRQILVNPTYERSAERLVRFYDDEKKFDLAGHVLQVYSDVMPNKAWVGLRYAKRQVEANNYAGAEATLKKAIRFTKDDSLDLKLMLAYVSREQGNYGQALAILQELQKTPADADLVNYHLGTVYEAMGNADAALDSYAAVNPESKVGSKAIISTAGIYEAHGDIDEALAALKQVPESQRSEVFRTKWKEIVAAKGGDGSEKVITAGGKTATGLPKEVKQVPSRSPASTGTVTE